MCAHTTQSIDEEGREWEQGCTLDSKMRSLETTSASLTLVDTPGSPDLTHATVAGLAGADAMVLVVDASEGAGHPVATHCLPRTTAPVSTNGLEYAPLDQLQIPSSCGASYFVYMLCQHWQKHREPTPSQFQGPSRRELARVVRRARRR